MPSSTLYQGSSSDSIRSGGKVSQELKPVSTTASIVFDCPRIPSTVSSTRASSPTTVPPIMLVSFCWRHQIDGHTQSLFVLARFEPLESDPAIDDRCAFHPRRFRNRPFQC